jgi:hypothetical protein
VKNNRKSFFSATENVQTFEKRRSKCHRHQPTHKLIVIQIYQEMNCPNRTLSRYFTTPYSPSRVNSVCVSCFLFLTAQNLRLQPLQTEDQARSDQTKPNQKRPNMDQCNRLKKDNDLNTTTILGDSVLPDRSKTIADKVIH